MDNEKEMENNTDKAKKMINFLNKATIVCNTRFYFSKNIYCLHAEFHQELFREEAVLLNPVQTF